MIYGLGAFLKMGYVLMWALIAMHSFAIVAYALKFIDNGADVSYALYFFFYFFLLTFVVFLKIDRIRSVRLSALSITLSFIFALVILFFVGIVVSDVVVIGSMFAITLFVSTVSELHRKYLVN